MTGYRKVARSAPCWRTSICITCWTCGSNDVSGRAAEATPSSRGLPATFIFLGFVHYLRKTRRGTILIDRKPSVKARERFVRKAKAWATANKHQPVRTQQAHLAQMLNGHYQYFGLRMCTAALSGVRWRVQKVWWRALRRRSQKAKRRCDWETLNKQPWFRLPPPRVTQAWV